MVVVSVVNRADEKVVRMDARKAVCLDGKKVVRWAGLWDIDMSTIVEQIQSCPDTMYTRKRPQERTCSKDRLDKKHSHLLRKSQRGRRSIHLRNYLRWRRSNLSRTRHVFQPNQSMEWLVIYFFS